MAWFRLDIEKKLSFQLPKSLDDVINKRLNVKNKTLIAITLLIATTKRHDKPRSKQGQLKTSFLKITSLSDDSSSYISLFSCVRLNLLPICDGLNLRGRSSQCIHIRSNLWFKLLFHPDFDRGRRAGRQLWCLDLIRQKKSNSCFRWLCNLPRFSFSFNSISDVSSIECCFKFKCDIFWFFGTNNKIHIIASHKASRIVQNCGYPKLLKFQF